jgi:hypothetical protein
MESERTNHERLRRLADFFVEDVLSASDEEILAELDSEGGADALKAEMTADVEAAKTRLGKAKLAAARRAVSADRTRRHSRQRFAPDQARKRLTEAVKGHVGSTRLTLAAREGQGIPDEDLEGLIEDATDLGLNIGEATEDSSDSG